METIKVDGMSCQHCVGSVKKALEALDGLSDVEVSLETGEVSFSSDGVAKDQIKSAILKIGFVPID